MKIIPTIAIQIKKSSTSTFTFMVETVGWRHLMWKETHFLITTEWAKTILKVLYKTSI
jgi:hypothetical protein